MKGACWLTAFAIVAIISAPCMACDAVLASVFSAGSAAKPDSGGEGFVVEDASGKRTGALRPAAKGYIVEDAHGQRIGSIEYDSALDRWRIEECSLDGTVTSRLVH
jgi:hypothetical protein